MAEIAITLSDDGRRVATSFTLASEQAAISIFKVTRHFGQLLQTRVKANANTGTHKPGLGHIPGTGPGPNKATGDYLRSIGLEMQEFRSGEVTAEVGTNAVQGRRLEFGFVGTDAAGRTFPSPRIVNPSEHARAGYPYPHFGPALEAIKDPYTQAIARIVEAL